MRLLLALLLLFPLELLAFEAQRAYDDSYGVPLHAEVLLPYRIVYIPGFLSDASDPLRKRYFREQMDELRAAGLTQGEDFVRLDKEHGYDGEASVEENSWAVARLIRESERPVLLVSHSKGSVESLVALLDYRELRDKVAAWFSIQGVFGGSPVADQVASKGWSRGPMWAYLGILGGSLEALLGIRTAPRQSFLHERDAEIRALTSVIPVLSYRSHLPTAEMHWSLRQVRELFGDGTPENTSDGVVPLAASELPGAFLITEQGPDHIDTVARSSSRSFDRKRFHWTGLRLMIEAEREFGRTN